MLRLNNKLKIRISVQSQYKVCIEKDQEKLDTNMTKMLSVGEKIMDCFIFLLYTFLCNFSLNHTYKSGFGGLYKEVTQ